MQFSVEIFTVEFVLRLLFTIRKLALYSVFLFADLCYFLSDDVILFHSVDIDPVKIYTDTEKHS